jgi:hypothetical protein
MDADGNVHYSDRPVEEQAEEIKIRNASIPSDQEDEEDSSGSGESKEAKGVVKAAESAEGVTPESEYTELQILEPEENQTIRNDEGEVRVGILLDPALRDGHKMVLKVNGAPLANNPGSTHLMLNNVPRGSHTLDASIVNEEGETLISAPPVHFHMRKAGLPTTTDEP